MDLIELTETVWRRALATRGKDWVVSELGKRPGHPTDPVLDIVFEPPFPTREFCMQWCAEEDNKIFSISWHTCAVAAALLVTVFCCYVAISGLNSIQPPAVAGPVPAQPVAANRYPSSLSNTASQSPAAGLSGNNNSNSLPSVCAYQSYQTDECKQQQ